MPHKATSSHQQPDDLRLRRSLLLSMVVSVLAILWFPFVLVINPGWVTLLAMTLPGLLVFILPVLVSIATKRLGIRAFQKPFKQLLIAFYTCWFLSGLFIVNFGDTEESVQSLFSRLAGDLASRDVLVDISYAACGVLLVAAVIISIALCFFRRIIARQKPLDN